MSKNINLFTISRIFDRNIVTRTTILSSINSINSINSLPQFLSIRC